MIFCTGLESFAHQTSAQPESSFQGSVVKDQGREPLKKATVQIISEDQDALNYTAVTDQDGHFAVDNMRPGRYRVFVERTGFIEVGKNHRRSLGTAIALDSGQKLNDFVFRMLPAAVVTGRVVDEDGDPMPNVEIAVLHYSYSSGARRLEPERSERTNDLGEYRVGNLSPGQYFVAASPAPEFISPKVKGPDDPAKKDLGYVTTFYPGTVDRNQATPLQLHPGDDVPIDFTLVPGHTFHIRGRVTSLAASGGNKPFVMLMPKEIRTVFSAAEVQADGSFDIPGVAPGSYMISAVAMDAEHPQSAYQSIDVSGSDVNGIRLAASSGSEVRGQVRVDGVQKPDLSQLTFFLRPVDDDGVSSLDFGYRQTLASVKPDGSFELKAVPAGVYQLELEGSSRSMRDYFLKTVVSSGRESANRILRVSGGAVISVDVVVSSAGGEITGVAVDEKNQPVASAMVVAIPDGENNRDRTSYKQAETDQLGRFNLRGLRPGDYHLMAWDYVEDGAFYDPQFVKPYESPSKAVHVTERGQEHQIVRVQHAAE